MRSDRGLTLHAWGTAGFVTRTARGRVATPVGIDHWRRGQLRIAAISAAAQHVRRRVRKDAGTRRAVSSAVVAAVVAQHCDHPSWSYQLHADNLVALAALDAALGRVPCSCGECAA